jgi:hypothetical protein
VKTRPRSRAIVSRCDSERACQPQPRVLADRLAASWPGLFVSANILVMNDRAEDDARDARARDNMAYVGELLAERQPGFAALLRAVERQIDQDLADDSCGWRRSMNTAWLYHLDGSVCVDSWSCQVQAHTSVPPRCGAQAAGCELPKGHPGPHLLLTDLEPCGAGDEYLAAEEGGTTAGVLCREHPGALAS